MSVGAAALLCASPGYCQDSRDAKPTVSVDPISTIIDALATHQVVALWHGNEELHAFRLKLLRDPRLPSVVRDIVVEGGIPEDQDTLDRFVNGSDVARDDLRRVWVDAAFAVDNGVAEELYGTVQAVNSALPAERRLRIVLGEPPATNFTMEGEAELIRRNVLDKGRNALIIYGEMHFLRKPVFFPVSDAKFAEFIFTHPDSVSTVAHLESAGISVFSVFAQARRPPSFE
jgi:hypothetical protein